MKATIYDSGESESNINPNEMTIEVNHETNNYDNKEREELRKTFKKFAINTFDFMDNTRVLFDDECPDCFHKMTRLGRCTNEHCPNQK